MTNAQEPRWRVTLADNTIDEREIDAVTAVLRSRWLSMGPGTRAFEREFAALHGAPDAVAVSSGTAALHLAAMALGLRPGDEVIMPSLTFVASAATVALQGATPVFADIRSERDLTVDPEDVARLVTARTRAVVAMHYGGHPAATEALRELADRHGLSLVEDAAHAPWVRSGDRMLGCYGDLACFSFFATKNVTAGEGGMVLARDPELLARVRHTRAHALSATALDRLRTGDAGYDVTALGLNYRPTEITAALGRAQLGRLADDRARRRGLVATYRAALRAVPGLVIPFDGSAADSAHHLMAVLLPSGADRRAIRERLTAARIQTSVHYPPTHLFSYYRDTFASARRPLPVTEAVAPRLLSLPLHSRMTDADASLVAAELAAAVDADARA